MRTDKTWTVMWYDECDKKLIHQDGGHDERTAAQAVDALRRIGYRAWMR